MIITEVCIKYIIFLDLYLSCWVPFLGCFVKGCQFWLDPHRGVVYRQFRPLRVVQSSSRLVWLFPRWPITKFRWSGGCKCHQFLSWEAQKSEVRVGENR